MDRRSGRRCIAPRGCTRGLALVVASAVLSGAAHAQPPSMTHFGSEYATVAAAAATLFNASPSVVASASGDTIVAWQQYDTAGSNGWDIYVQRYDSQGNAQGAPLLANNLIRGGCQRNPAVAADPAGNFVVAWEDNGANIRARLFPASGAAADELLVNSSTSPARRGRPAVGFVPAVLGRF